MANELKDRIHTSVATGSGDWASFRSEVTGKFLNDGGTGAGAIPGVNYTDFSNHLIREYNKQVDIRIDSWTGAAGQTTGLLIEPFDAGFRYTGTGNFSNYP
tara:strand:+ start:144 stop:446 length:303 start_codon:yes stop_codon:yes gene_type:complete